MSAEDIEQAARADPDAQPLTEADFNRMQVIPRVKIIRRALDLTQEEFAERYRSENGVPSFSAVGDQVRLGQFVIFDFEFTDESGTHAELVAANGRYAELFELQAAGYR